EEEELYHLAFQVFQPDHQSFQKDVILHRKLPGDVVMAPDLAQIDAAVLLVLAAALGQRENGGAQAPAPQLFDRRLPQVQPPRQLERRRRPAQLDQELGLLPMQAGGQLLQPARRPAEAAMAAVPQVVPVMAVYLMGGVGAEPRSPFLAVLFDSD